MANELDDVLLSSLADSEELLKHKLQQAYGTSLENWNDLKIFQGGLVNFGYWKNITIPVGRLNIDQRIASALALYDHVGMQLEISLKDNVLEAGCGRGVGTAYIYRRYHPAQLIGIDMVSSQIQKANEQKIELLDQPLSLQFLVSDIEKNNFPSHFFDKIYSIEMLQHIHSWKAFAKEARRIIKEPGRLVIATYFPTGNVFTEELAKLLPLIKEGLENPTPIHEVVQILREADFNDVQVQSIGQYVFEGYHHWACQVEAENIFTYNYLEAYKKKMIDYYVLTLSARVVTQERSSNASYYSH